MIRIAIDAMGGDNGPPVLVQAVKEAAMQWTDTTFFLVGKPPEIKKYLGTDIPKNIEVVPAKEMIENEDEPVQAVRRKKESSMVVAGKLVKEGSVDAMISCGNTGALMVTGLLILGRMKGIERPGLAAMIPTVEKPKGLLALDMGANMDAKPEHLRQYACMGSLYRQKVHQIKRPKVGLLNVGAEAKKGNELTKTAFTLLKEAPIEFIGNVEARDVLVGTCDVLICDGFSGNILLKAIEGTASTIFTLLKQELTSSLKAKLAAATLKSNFRQIHSRLDYHEHNGAPLLGINGLVVKGHGSSNIKAMKTAIAQTRHAICNQVISSLVNHVKD